MASRAKWEDMVGAIVGAVSSKKEPKQESKAEGKKLSIEDIPGDPGSTVGTLRKRKQDLERDIADL